MIEIDTSRNWCACLHQIPKIIFPKIIFEKKKFYCTTLIYFLLHNYTIGHSPNLRPHQPFTILSTNSLLSSKGSTSPNPKSDLKPWHLCLSLLSHIYNCLQCISIWVLFHQYPMCNISLSLSPLVFKCPRIEPFLNNKNCRTRCQQNGEIGTSPIINSSTKVTDTLAKTVKTNFFRTLETNEKFVIIR